MVKHTQTIRWQQLTNCLSVFDHFVKLALKVLSWISTTLTRFIPVLYVETTGLHKFRTRLRPYT